MGTRYRPNEPRFVDETVDGEALIMDMVRGNYYSCAGASATAWNALRAGCEVTDVADLLATAYGIARGDVSRDLDGFVAALLAEEMLVPAADAPGADGAAWAPPAAEPAALQSAYDGLRLERYSDLADLILLDPVHDVTEAGWPHTEP